MEEAELRRLEEAAAREAAIEKQKQENEDKLRKQLEEEVLQLILSMKFIWKCVACLGMVYKSVRSWQCI